MNDSTFYVNTPSDPTTEFPDNKPHDYRVRFANPLSFVGENWWVGLSSISLPDPHLTLTKILTNENVLAMDWAVNSSDAKTTTPIFTKVELPSLDDMKAIRDGEQFMKAVISDLQKQMTATYVQKHSETSGPLKLEINTKLLYVAFRWELRSNEQELVLDNTKTWQSSSTVTEFPKFMLSEEIALKMGWLIKEKGVYKIGPNLVPEINSKILEDNDNVHNSTIDPITKKPALFAMWENYKGQGPWLELGLKCNWRFINLNAAYRSITGLLTHRTLYVYSDIGSGMMIGKRMTDLLREVQYKRTTFEGTVYFEPTHIQFHPIRSNLVNTVQVQISETNGSLVAFSHEAEPVIVTLVFKHKV